MDDHELLHEFVKDSSQEAFGELVERHLPVVYSAARRMVRDSHLAEEVAQSVFAMLAQKAGSLRRSVVLGGWLYNTTRNLAMHTVRTEQRRREREQIACAMQALEQTPGIPDIAEHLEPAMAELDPEDRDALVLRYLGERPLREVGAELGISEEAARKRVGRALERLRGVLEHGSVCTSTVPLAAALAASMVTVPSGLAATVTTNALVPCTAATMITRVGATVKAKTILAMIAGLIVVGAGTGAYLLAEPKSAPSSAPARTVPGVRLANNIFLPFEGYPEQVAVAGQQYGTALLGLGAALHTDDRFSNDVSADVRRTTNSQPAGHIKCLVAPVSPGSADYLATLSTRPLQASRFTRYDVGTNSAISGKRIRVSAWLKTREVDVKAGGFLVIVNAEGHIFACDPMTDRPINGTTEWNEIEMITDVPSEACTIYVGATLYGGGEIWVDDFQVALAPPDKAITDDRVWHVWSPNPTDYSLTTDQKETHDGHPTLRIAYLPTDPAPRGSWMWWGQDIRDPDKYRGHTVRMTVWAKSENIDGNVRPNLRPKGPFFRLLAQDKKVGGKQIRRTTEWMQHTILCKIPEATQCLDTGFAFHGGGKLWIDMQSLKYEIADEGSQ
jgi:RNA polymerase sigma factor (sigma-70 family)